MPVNGTTNQRGYGASHKAARARMKPEVDAGLAHCTRCGRWIDPAQPWDADHTEDRTGYIGPAHRSCNRRAGAIKGNKQRGATSGRNAGKLRRWNL